jgi:hypothetical protein
MAAAGNSPAPSSGIVRRRDHVKMSMFGLRESERTNALRRNAAWRPGVEWVRLGVHLFAAPIVARAPRAGC